MGTIDLNSVDSYLTNIIHADEYNKILTDMDTNGFDLLFKDQYIELNDLGYNILTKYEIEDDQLLTIFKNLLIFVNNNYLTIGDYDNLLESPNRLLIAGSYLYQFFCVDSVITILPVLLDKLGCFSIDDFDDIVNKRYIDNSVLRKDLLEIIQNIIKQLLKLKELDKNVLKNEKFQSLLGKFYYYQEMIEYGDLDNFLEKFIYLVLYKYWDNIVWRSL